MMESRELFGLGLEPLFKAIGEVESGNGSASPNVYQIGTGYIADANRILARRCRVLGVACRPFPDAARFDRRASEAMMVVYWRHWGEHYEKTAHKPVTCETLARIHNGGPLGWRKPATLAYWAKVRAAMGGVA